MPPPHASDLQGHPQVVGAANAKESDLTEQRRLKQPASEGPGKARVTHPGVVCVLAGTPAFLFRGNFLLFLRCSTKHGGSPPEHMADAKQPKAGMWGLEDTGK